MRHYKPRLVYIFSPIFHYGSCCRAVILQTIYALNKEILPFFGLKSAVYNQERVIIACVKTPLIVSVRKNKSNIEDMFWFLIDRHLQLHKKTFDLPFENSIFPEIQNCTTIYVQIQSLNVTFKVELSLKTSW